MHTNQLFSSLAAIALTLSLAACDSSSSNDTAPLTPSDDTAPTTSNTPVPILDPIPTAPATPEAPAAEEEPATPEVPATPEEPTTEEEPATPEVPATPEEPTTEEEPATPEDPATEEEPVVEADPVEPTGFLSHVSVDGQEGDFFTTEPPGPIGDLILAPLTDDETAVSIIPGGSIEIALSADNGFSTIYLASALPSSESSLFQEGYFIVQLPEAATSASVVVTADPEADNVEQLLGVIIGSPTGDISEVQTLDLAPVEVGTGDVQVSVSWDLATDVDLHLFEPTEDHIYFNNQISDAGGELDLDSNPACVIDGVNNENITYEGVTPPSGEYRVAVHYYSACSISTPTNYVVTVRANGTTTTYPGSLTDGGGDSPLIDITRFTIQ